MSSLSQALAPALREVQARYAAANPKSQKAQKEAERYLPGGNTRAVLHFDPFPLTIVRGEGAMVEDLDGHQYVDFVGEYAAGIYGHSDPHIKAAIHEALENGISFGAPGLYERELASLLCNRFDSIDQIRFCNSGTEANLVAFAAARVITGRSKLLVFNGAYHGGVLKFPNGHYDLNVPFDFIYAEFNDTTGTAELIRQSRNDLAAVVAEPILGAGGNIPGNPEFLNMLRDVTRECGCFLIFDEIKTARLGPAGMQGLTGVSPDMTTLGKIIGGGLPTGAFGGSTDIMQYFNTQKANAWRHSGTFNNNVCSLAAGCAAMGKSYTAERASEFFEWSEAVRNDLNELFQSKEVSMICNGLGSMFAIHFFENPLQRRVVRDEHRHALHKLLHLELLLSGFLIVARGDLFLSLALTNDHVAHLRSALEQFIDRHKSMLQSLQSAAGR